MTILEQILPQFMLRFFEFLRIPLIENGLIILHYGWSLIHIIFSALIFYLVRKEKYPLLIVFELLVLFELGEFIFSYIIPVILPEKIIDTAWDLILGMSSAVISYIFLKIKE